MRTTLVLATAAALALAAFAFAPTASAQTSCSFDLWTWHASYDCEVQNVGGEGTLVWCPDPFTCLDSHFIGCSFDLSPPWYCWR